MGLVDYLRKEMKIRKPFLYLFTAFSSFGVGAVGMYALEGPKVTKLREELSETRQEMIRIEAEWQKKLKDKTRTIRVVNSDGSSREEITNDISMDESGQYTIDATQLATKLQLIDYKIDSGYTLNALWFPSFSNPAYTSAIGVSVSKEVLWGLGVGPIVTYDMDSNKFMFGISLSYSF